MIFFLFGMIADLIGPIGMAVVAALAFAVLAFGLKEFRLWPELVLAVAMFAVQLTLLILWFAEITPAQAFDSRSDASARVMDSHLYQAIDQVFWKGATVLALVMTPLAIAFRMLTRRPRVLSGGVAFLIVGVVLELPVFALMGGYMPGFRTCGASLSDSVSPDQKIEVRLVPMNCMTDTNGLVVYRHKGQTWWHPIGTIGDSLTGRAAGEFQWSNSVVELPAHGFRFDFQELESREQSVKEAAHLVTAVVQLRRPPRSPVRLRSESQADGRLAAKLSDAESDF